MTPEASVWDDPLYTQGMAHLQAGEWQEAIRCFEALQLQYPGDSGIRQALDEARFKAKIDSSSKVRPRRTFIAWRPLLLRAAILAAAIVAVVLVVRVITDQALPAFRNARELSMLEELLNNAEAFVEQEEFERAQQNVDLVLQQDPGDERALELQARIDEGSQRLAMYRECERLYKTGDLEAALEQCSEVSRTWPGYRDTTDIIQDITVKRDQASTFEQAKALVEAGNCQEAMPMLQRLQTWVSFRPDEVDDMVVTCSLVLARELIYQNPPVLTALPQAAILLRQVLSLEPTNAEAATELDVLTSFLDGKQRYEEGYTESALPLLRAAFNAQPGYQGGMLRDMLYDAYVRSGDDFRDAGDCGQAYERYRQACEDLGAQDTVLACERQGTVAACLTPTATPTPTPTATPTPKPTPLPGPTATPTPPPPLATFRNQIVYQSASPEQPGFWIMNPDGTNRRYLGNSARLQAEYDQLREQETFDPAGRCRAYTTEGADDTSPQVYVQCQKPSEGPAPTWKVSKGLNKVSYDPVWAPDGSRIAFISQTNGSDDLWVSDPLGESLWNYTKNAWEWEKHPSFSPDSQRIVFWSNREGTKQIYIIDADGRNLKKVFSTTWDEFDPLWIK